MRSSVSYIFEEIIFKLFQFKYLLSPEVNKNKKKVLVNGTPRTGTTWIIRMLTSIPGYRSTGNFGYDILRFNNVKPGDVVHGHLPHMNETAELIRNNAIKLIITLRDPRDQLISNMFHIRFDKTNVLHQRIVEMSDDQAINAFIEGRPGVDGYPGLGSVISRMNISLSWSNSSFPVCCIRYEDLIKNPNRILKSALSDLEMDIDDSLLSRIIQKNRFRRLTIGRKLWKKGRKAGQEDQLSHYRKGIIGDWRNYFTADHKKMFKESTGMLLIDLGYEHDNNW